MSENETEKECYVVFDFLFDEYKISALPKTKRKLQIKEWFVFSSPAVFLLAYFFVAVNNPPAGWHVAFVILILVSFIVFYLYGVTFKRNKYKELLKSQKARIESLKELLKNKEFNLYTQQGLEWAIASCEKEIARSFFVWLSELLQNFVNTVSPIVMLLIGAFIGLSREMLIEVTAVIIVLIVFGFICYVPLASSSSDMVDIEKANHMCLLRDLEYIKTQIEK